MIPHIRSYLSHPCTLLHKVSVDVTSLPVFVDKNLGVSAMRSYHLHSVTHCIVLMYAMRMAALGSKLTCHKKHIRVLLEVYIVLMRMCSIRMFL